MIKINPEANQYICDAENGSLHMQILGPQYFDQLFNSEHKDKVAEIGELLYQNKMFFMPIEWCDAFLNGEITKEEFMLGHKVFSFPIEPQIGLPSLAIKLRFGEDCKINKSVSSRGKREEWTYYGKHKEMERNVIAYEFKFVDGKLDAYEDKTDNCYFQPVNYASYDNELSTGTPGNLTWSRNIVAGVGDKEDEWIQGVLSMVHTESLKKVESLFVSDFNLDLSIEWFELYDEQGKYDLSRSAEYSMKMSRYISDEEERVLHAHEIAHATTVLGKAAANDDNLKKYGQDFLDRYTELMDVRMNQIEMLTVSELKEIGYEFDSADDEARYSKLYDGAVEKYRSEIPDEPPFSAEFNEFKVALEAYKNKQCVVATAATGDRNHYIVKDLRCFRDNSLSHLRLGKLFIKYYYKLGPYYASMIKKSYLLRKLTLELLIKPVHLLIRKK